MKLIILICLLALLPPLPIERKFRKIPTTHQATQLLFKPSPLSFTLDIVIKLYYPTNHSTKWCLIASSNMNDWFIYPTNWIYFRPDGDIQITNEYKQMYFRVWFP